MLTRPEFIEVLKAGDIEQAKTEMVRYGKILDVKDTEDERGAHRVYVIEHFHRDFTVCMTNGDVTKITFTGVMF